MELLRARREEREERAKRRPGPPAAPQPETSGKTFISDLIDRWKTGNP
jgi:hypothetical protein